MVGWVRNLISNFLPIGRPESVGQGAGTFEKKARAKLIDLADGVALTEEARRNHLRLDSLKPKGQSPLQGLRMRRKIRKRVGDSLGDGYEIPEIMEEVTEKILEVTQHDPFYRRLFQ